MEDSGMTDKVASIEDSASLTANNVRKRKVIDLLDAMEEVSVKASKQDKPPSYAPWDRESLLLRLATYKLYPDHSISSPVSAFALARRGWQHVVRDTVECIKCRARIVLQIHSERQDMYEALQERFGELVVSHHHKNCPWKFKGCDTELLRLSLADSRAALKSMADRSSTFEELKMVLPSAGKLPQEGLSELTPDKIYALFGWSASTIGSTSIVSCADCLSHALLTTECDLDMINEHHSYCPWICPQVQRSDSEPGWRILLSHVTQNSQQGKNLQDSSAVLEDTEQFPSEQNYKERIARVKILMGMV